MEIVTPELPLISPIPPPRGPPRLSHVGLPYVAGIRNRAFGNPPIFPIGFPLLNGYNTNQSLSRNPKISRVLTQLPSTPLPLYPPDGIRTR